MSKLEDITTLTEEESTAIRKVIVKILEKFDVKRMLLFGSKARGDFNDDSDIDVLILANEEIGIIKTWEISDISTDIAVECDIFVSCKIFNYSDWEGGNEDKIFLPFRENVEMNGVEIEFE